MTDEKRFISSAEDILSIDDANTRDVYVKEWDAWVTVKSLTGAERDEFEESIVDVQGERRRVIMRNIRAKLVARTVIDQEGNRLFTNADVEKLGNKNASALDKLFSVAQELSGLSNDDVEQMAQNLGPDQNGQGTLDGPQLLDTFQKNS